MKKTQDDPAFGRHEKPVRRIFSAESALICAKKQERHAGRRKRLDRAFELIVQAREILETEPPAPGSVLEKVRIQSVLLEKARTQFVTWMADRIYAKKHTKTRKEAIRLAWGYLEIAESDGQGGWNLTFSRTYWTEKYAHHLADRGIERDKWYAEEC